MSFFMLLLSLSATASTVDSLDASIQRALNETPDLAQRLLSLTPRSTRSGQLKLSLTDLDHPDANALIASRLLTDDEAPADRVAFAGALDPADVELIEQLYAREHDPMVRGALIGRLKSSKSEAVVSLLHDALNDDAPSVRAIAAHSAGFNPHGHQLIASLQPLTADPSARVRLQVTRSLAHIGTDAAWHLLLGQLNDRSSEVRLHALFGLKQLDLSPLNALPIVHRLRLDPDPHVAQLAQTILALQ